MNQDLLRYVQNFAITLPPKGQGKVRHVETVMVQLQQKFNLFISCELAEYVCSLSVARWWIDQLVVILALNVRYVEYIHYVEQCIQTPDNHPWLADLENNDRRYRTMLSTWNFKHHADAMKAAMSLTVDDIMDLEHLREASYPVNDENDETFFRGTNIRSSNTTECLRWLAVQELFQRHLPRTHGHTGFETIHDHSTELRKIHACMVESAQKMMSGRRHDNIITANTMMGGTSISIQGHGREDEVDRAWLELEAENMKLKRGKHFPPIPGHDPDHPWKSQNKGRGR